jgi:hypothetical protein
MIGLVADDNRRMKGPDGMDGLCDVEITFKSGARVNLQLVNPRVRSDDGSLAKLEYEDPAKDVRGPRLLFLQREEIVAITAESRSERSTGFPG